MVNVFWIGMVSLLLVSQIQVGLVEEDQIPVIPTLNSVPIFILHGLVKKHQGHKEFHEDAHETSPTDCPHNSMGGNPI